MFAPPTGPPQPPVSLAVQKNAFISIKKDVIDAYIDAQRSNPNHPYLLRVLNPNPEIYPEIGREFIYFKRFPAVRDPITGLLLSPTTGTAPTQEELTQYYKNQPIFVGTLMAKENNEHSGFLTFRRRTQDPANINNIIVETSEPVNKDEYYCWYHMHCN